MAGAFICFSHLTDQASIWKRHLIPSSQKSGMKMSQLRELPCELSGILLGNSCLLQVKLLRRGKWFSRPALAANSSSLLSLVHLFLHRPDHVTRHSLVACPFADNSFPLVYLRLLARSQPGPVGCFSAVSYSSTVTVLLWTWIQCCHRLGGVIFWVMSQACCHADLSTV